MYCPLWRYVERSVAFLFGDDTGDTAADTILRVLRERGPQTRTQICDLFRRHLDLPRISAALCRLESLGKAARAIEATGGRPTERWRAT
jgi:hypothetical protein